MRGELDLATAPRLAVRIDAARRDGARRLLIDLTAAEFCDSTGLRALIGCRRETDVDGGRLAVAAQTDSAIGRMFELAGAHEMLPVYGDTESALAALAPRSS
jgi:anti-anti-sigma factor